MRGASCFGTTLNTVNAVITGFVVTSSSQERINKLFIC